ncbi:MAG: T9SS type A sorting domain-containing protein [Bacteroidales bacterium]|nr:T9SS type A sorting domain-containing protein [Bacteroidales bacterium]MCF8338049.1 T9SS type A sorting domain-containing protein [Bacteroidales bacterium]
MKKYVLILIIILGKITVFSQSDELMAFVDDNKYWIENAKEGKIAHSPAKQAPRVLFKSSTLKTSIAVIAVGCIGDNSGLSARNNIAFPVWTDNLTADALTYRSPVAIGCEDNLTLQDDEIGIGDAFTYQVNNTLTVAGNNSISVIKGNGTEGGRLVLTAGESIDLLPGFSAETGSEFDAKIEDCSGTTTSIESPDFEENESQTSYIKVYPNPNNGLFNIDIQIQSSEESKRLYFKVTDLLGKSYLTQDVHNQNNIKINLSDLIPGVYVLNFYIEKAVVETHKIIIK